jgi:hypothetical protein
VRDTVCLGGERASYYLKVCRQKRILFKGSQAIPARPSDKDRLRVGVWICFRSDRCLNGSGPRRKRLFFFVVFFCNDMF